MGLWSTLLGTGAAVAGVVTGNPALIGAGTSIIGAGVSADVFADDHYSEATRTTAGSFPGVSVRCSGNPGVMNWYTWFSSGTLQKCVGGVITTLATISSFGNGDTARLVVVGTLLECFKNGVSQGSHNDASIASGSAGLVINNAFGDGPKLDAWSGNDIGGAVSRSAVFLGTGTGQTFVG